MRRVYTVACLAGDGLGPELMAEASRTLRKVARMHGFAVDDVHVPFGNEALTRSGHPLPPATRSAVLDADAVLVADAGDPALGGVEPDLDLRATATHVVCDHGDLVLLTPIDLDSDTWTVERAFGLARRRRGRLVAVDHDAEWAALVDEVDSRRDGVDLDRLTLAEAVRVLAFEPGRVDVVVASGVVASALSDLAVVGAGDPRLAATGRLAGNGPSVFAPSRVDSADDAGHGVADPGSMLVAVSLLLREGLGETHAAETLTAALRDARAGGTDSLASVRRTLQASTRDFGDAVVRMLPAAHRNAEFVAGGVGSTEPPKRVGAGFAGARAEEPAA
jgi:3-isopropylmalate dehydrogenase